MHGRVPIVTQIPAKLLIRLQLMELEIVPVVIILAQHTHKFRIAYLGPENTAGAGGDGE
jgi:hypothetical protein